MYGLNSYRQTDLRQELATITFRFTPCLSLPIQKRSQKFLQRDASRTFQNDPSCKIYNKN